MSVGQVTTVCEGKTHDSIAGLQKGSEDGHVSRRTGQRLHVDVPLFSVEAVGLEGSLLAQELDLVDVLISTVEALAGVSFGILVAKAGAHSLHDSLGCEILTRNQFEASELSLLLKCNYLCNFWILVDKILVRHW